MTYRLDEDCELPPRLVALFLRTAPAQMDDLVRAFDARDSEAARAQAHKLKGALYAAGASRMADDLEAMRAVISVGDWPTAIKQMARAREDFASVIDQWRARLAAGS